MAWIKTKEEIESLRETGRIHARILSELGEMAKPGVTTKSLDKYAEEAVRASGGVPAFLNYRPDGASYPYPATLCVAINDEVVHGIPSEKKMLKEGDIFSIDLGIKKDGLVTDAGITVPVGKISHELQNLIVATNSALYAGIEAMKPSNYIGDIGFAISEVAKEYGYGVVRDLAGHGVGHMVHEDPYVPNYGKKGEGYELETGMVLALEPMLTLGAYGVSLAEDGYTFSTKDGSMCAHSEHTVAVGDDEPIILTEQ